MLAAPRLFVCGHIKRQKNIDPHNARQEPSICHLPARLPFFLIGHQGLKKTLTARICKRLRSPGIDSKVPLTFTDSGSGFAFLCNSYVYFEPSQVVNCGLFSQSRKLFYNVVVSIFLYLELINEQYFCSPPWLHGCVTYRKVKILTGETNEKVQGPGRWQMFGIVLCPWRWMSFYFVSLLPS